MALRLRWRSIGIVLLLVGAAIAVAGFVYADRLVETRLRRAIVSVLEKRLNSRVELGDLQVRMLPMLSIRGEELSVRHHGRTDIPPVISARAFTISASLGQLWERRVDRVHLEGLEIIIPPRRGADMPKLSSEDRPATDPGSDKPEADNVLIRELLTEDSLLLIESKREDKGPRVFQIRRLKFADFQFGRAVPFEAAVTNPTPSGEVDVVGNFGPWAADQPSLTPIDGTFTFDADLGTIKGIGGSLHAEGGFSGPLELIRTSGRTRTEDFHLSTGGAKFPLLVDYDAVVDGTNGDTTLERVEGTLGQTKISAKGAIVKGAAGKGRHITLDTQTRGGRLDDLIKLTTKVKSSPMTGIANVKARLEIPPGEPEVIERMDLEGTFDVSTVRFTSEAIQKRVDELSRRGSGKPADLSIENVASNFRGSFRLNDARMQIRALTFSVEGAAVQIAGAYDVRRELMDFKGELRLQAKVSQTQTGWKRLVLKIFDPMLDGVGAGTVIPISVSGTRDEPKFAADIKKAVLR